MEHPVFSLGTRPDMRVLEYERKGKWIKIHPSGYGLATIFDKDVLLYCGSLLMEQINQGEVPPKTLRFSAHDLLVTTNRQTSGEGYDLLHKALLRLRGTTIETNILTNDIEMEKGFGIINEYDIIRKSRPKGRMLQIQVELSNWFYNALIGKEVLSISPDYFRLRRPLERRLYELGRKHCGKQGRWSVGLAALRQKVGTTAPLKKLSFNLRNIEQTDHLPHYRIEVHEGSVTFINRSKEVYSEGHDYPRLEPGTYEKAKRVAPGYDIYFLEDEWQRFWVSSGKPRFRSPDGAFIAFCKKRHVMNPLR